MGFIAGVVIVALELLALALWAGASFATPTYVFMRGPLPMLALFVGVTAQASAGLVLAARRPDNRVGWAVVVFGLVAAVSLVVIAETAGDPDGSQAPLGRWFTWIGNWVLFPGASLVSFCLGFIFPDGRFASRAWARLFALVVLGCVLAAVLLAIRPGPMLFFPVTVNPLAFSGLTGALTPSGMAAAWYTALPLLLLAGGGAAAGAALLARHRAAGGDVRLQIRWYIAAGIVLAAAYVAQLLALLLLGPREPAGELIGTTLNLALGLPPVAITIAILRYRLYDIDTILSRAFVYGALTAVLAGIYTASIRAFNALFTAVTGDTSDVALVVTTLLLATTFTPIKSRLEKIAAERLVPAGGERPGADGGTATQPTVDPRVALLDDPAFAAAVDARVAAALQARGLAGSNGHDRPKRRRRAGASADPGA